MNNDPNDAVAFYGHLIPRNKRITALEFSRLIEENYDTLNPRNRFYCDLLKDDRLVTLKVEFHNVWDKVFMSLIR